MLGFTIYIMNDGPCIFICDIFSTLFAICLICFGVTFSEENGISAFLIYSVMLLLPIIMRRY